MVLILSLTVCLRSLYINGLSTGLNHICCTICNYRLIIVLAIFYPWLQVAQYIYPRSLVHLYYKATIVLQKSTRLLAHTVEELIAGTGSSSNFWEAARKKGFSNYGQDIKIIPPPLRIIAIGIFLVFKK